MTAETLSNIIHYIVEAPFFDEIIGKYFSRRSERDNFKSHVIMEIADIPLQKLQEAKEDGYLRWLFARIVKNQIVSNNSSWHNQHRIRITDVDPEGLNIQDEEEDRYEEYLLNKERFRLIKPAMNSILTRQYDKPRTKQIIVINMTCFSLYHFDGMTFNHISKETNISEATVYRAVKNAEVLIRTEINKMIKNKK